MVSSLALPTSFFSNVNLDVAFSCPSSPVTAHISSPRIYLFIFFSWKQIQKRPVIQDQQIEDTTGDPEGIESEATLGDSDPWRNGVGRSIRSGRD